MTPCASCGEPLALSDPRPTLRAEDGVYHLSCAPPALLETAAEEYRAILRKGVRYFLEKYGDGSVAVEDLGTRFLALGRAVESERDRRVRG